MTSLKSRMIYFSMKNSHLLRFKLRKEAWDWNTSIPAFRERCEKFAQRAGKTPEGVEVTPVAIEGLPAGLSAEWIRPIEGPGDKIIFYLHGGGYVSGSCNDHRAFVSKLVKWTGIGALLYEYRLAPEHPYPAAVDDTLTAYRWLLAQGFSAAQVVFVGESAGGGLALATLLALRDQGLPLPAAAVAMSPETDLKLTGESHRTKARMCLSPARMAEVCSKYYVGDADPTLPYISPLYGDLRGLPPLLIYVGEYEILLDDSIRFAEKARQAGVAVTLRVGEKLFHCYPLMAPLFPEASQAMDEIRDFLHQHLEQVAA